jgi:YrbI family 3-deoxy-D-manno-octulosonate 8-phosphate phosphatase
MIKYSKKLLNIAKDIKLIASDIDGVLTAGEIILLPDGNELKIWNVKDGAGVSLVKKHLPDIKFVWITARKSKQVKLRADDLKIDVLVQSCRDKKSEILKVAEKNNINVSQIAYIGDDVIDLPVLEIAGLSACPFDAVDDVKKSSKYICKNCGGKGAFREVCNLILKANEL